MKGTKYQGTVKAISQKEERKRYAKLINEKQRRIRLRIRDRLLGIFFNLKLLGHIMIRYIIFSKSLLCPIYFHYFTASQFTLLKNSCKNEQMELELHL